MRRAVLSLLCLVLMGAGVALAGGLSLSPKEELGKSIFFDDDLSINNNQACAACHAPEVGGTGPDSSVNAHGSVYEGSIPGRFGDRKPPASSYATTSPILHYAVDKKDALFVGGNFWDGRATGEKLGNPAADQAQGPFLNPMEQGLPDNACVVYRICIAAYPVAFEDVYPGGCDITWPMDIDTVCATEGATVSLSPADRDKADEAYDNAALAIAAYEGSSESNAYSSKFDYVMAGLVKFTKDEKKGYNVFRGKGKCSACHVLDPGADGPALFTDYTFDNLGVPKNPENPIYDRIPDYVDYGLGGFLATQGEMWEDLVEENLGKVKVPTLRNVDKRPDPGFVKAFGHNGYFKSLEGIVHFYNTRDVKDTCPGDYTEAEALAADCWPEPEVQENVNDAELGDLGLSAKEEAELVAFMKTLSDGYMP